MAHSVRLVQNKAKKETKEIKIKEVQELRKENQKLRRENSRLRRDLEKRLNYEPEEAEPDTLVPEIPKETCPDCNSTDISKMTLGTKEFTVCKTCKWRKVSA